MMRLLLIASTPYGYLHHRFQKLADGFRALGVPVTYFEQTYGWRAYLWGGQEGLGREIRSSVRHHARVVFRREPPAPVGGELPTRSEDKPAFEVVQLPLVIPSNRLNSGFIERLNANVFRSVVGERMRSGGGDETVALIDNPLWGAVLRRGDFTRVYYDCIDDVALYAGHASLERFLEYERRLVKCSDAVFVTAASLEERLRQIDKGKPVLRLPNGVDFDWFQQHASRRSTPEDIRTIPRPIVGYMGSIADWMDYDLVGAVAALLPGVSFVFVGPVDTPKRGERLSRSPNVYWLGRKEYQDVPATIGAFDVCWIPFLRGRIVEHTNPIKLYEYFALGKPTVTTLMPEVETYRQERLVYIGNGPQEMADALRTALQDGDHGRRAQRMAVARDHSWTNIVGHMHAVITGRHG